MVMTENPTLRRVNVIFCMCQNATGVVPLSHRTPSVGSPFCSVYALNLFVVVV